MSQLTEFRHMKDEMFAKDHQSPLLPEQQREFKGLVYYDENPDLVFTLDVDEFDQHEVVEMQTSTGDVARYARWGRIKFEVDAEPAELTLYKDPDHGEIFLPFVDATSGPETYGAGRYLEVEEVSNLRVAVNFNYAYSPYCAYNEMWSCPLTPFENRLNVPIRAGEKSFK